MVLLVSAQWMSAAQRAPHCLIAWWETVAHGLSLALVAIGGKPMLSCTLEWKQPLEAEGWLVVTSRLFTNRFFSERKGAECRCDLLSSRSLSILIINIAWWRGARWLFVYLWEGKMVEVLGIYRQLWQSLPSIITMLRRKIPSFT